MLLHWVRIACHHKALAHSSRCSAPTEFWLLAVDAGNCPMRECLPGAHSARYLSINYSDFSPRFTL